MNESLKSLDELNRATAPPVPADDTAQPAESELRETWLGLGKLLEATTPEGDAARLVRHLHQRRSQRMRRRALAGLTVAACAAGVVVSIVRSRVVELPAVPRIDRSEIVEPTPTKKFAPPVVDVQPTVIQPPRVESSLALAWDDRMELRLNRVHKKVQSMQRGRNHQSDAFAELRGRIGLLQRQMRNDPL
jgi:hypothetical protein